MNNIRAIEALNQRELELGLSAGGGSWYVREVVQRVGTQSKKSGLVTYMMRSMFLDLE